MMTKIWELFVDCSDILDIIEFDLFQIFFLVDLSMVDDVLIELAIGLRRGQFFPMA
jgi:hypothetical protein